MRFVYSPPTPMVASSADEALERIFELLVGAGIGRLDLPPSSASHG